MKKNSGDPYNIHNSQFKIHFEACKNIFVNMLYTYIKIII